MTPSELLKIRTDAGLSQEKFARKLEVVTATVRNWESFIKKGDIFADQMEFNIETRVKAWQSREKSK